MAATLKAMVSVCVVVIGLLAGTASAVTMATVPVGNAGNAADYTGYGSVGYSYNVGKYEVTAGQFTEFLNNKGGVDTYGLYNTGMSDTSSGSGISRSGGGTVGNPWTYSVASDFVNRPVNCVSYWDSCRFANWLHNGQGSGDTETGAYTLTTDGMNNNTVTRNAGWNWAVASENEWYKASYYDPNKPGGPGYWAYPTRSNTAPGQDMADASGNNANYYNYNDSSPYPIDSGKYTTVVGEFQNSASPYGTFDQGGNVKEWDEAVLYGAGRGLRGGSYYVSGGGTLASSYRDAGYPYYEYSYIGFRVVSEVPEPASLGLLSLGGLALLRRKRRA